MANSPRLPGLSPEVDIRHDVLRSILRKALLARETDSRFLELFSQGKLSGTVHTCIGQEFTGAILSQFLFPGDSIFSNHRCHGHFLSYCEDVEGLVAEVMGKETGVCRGLGGSQHLCKGNFFSNGIQGGILPVSAGLAMARKLKKSGNCSVVFIGDGTLGEGTVYETFNLAAKWSLPLVIVLENNYYAQSTSQEETLAGKIPARAEAFDIRTYSGSTWEWGKLYQEMESAVRYARTEIKPVFLCVDTYRLKAHSKGDDNRDPAEIRSYEERDPLTLILKTEQPEILEIMKSVKIEVDQAVSKALEAPYPKIQVAEMADPVRWVNWSPAPRMRYGQATNEAFHGLMKEREEILFFGEDVLSPYGGAFKISQGLSEQYPDRVWNTPISESTIIGLATGLSLQGYRPFVELMFGDFSGLAFDQIVNHAAKFQTMYAGQVKPNVVIRTPMGGRRGYGPTHSQSLEKHFLGIAGLRVVATHAWVNPAILYEALSRCEGPTFLAENKLLYSTFLPQEVPEGYSVRCSEEAFPVVWISPNARRVDVTICTYGGMAEFAIEAARRLFLERDLLCQVLLVTQLHPFSVCRYEEVWKVSKVFVAAEEGQGAAGWGAEVAAQLVELGFSGRVGRVFSKETCIPASKAMEEGILPNTNSIIERVLEVLR